MSLKLLNNLVLSLILLFSLLMSQSVFACDTKSCESAYLAHTKQVIANHVRRAEAHKVERHAHSLNRERRAYAEFVHKYFVAIRRSF